MKKVAWQKHSFGNKAHRLTTWQQHCKVAYVLYIGQGWKIKDLTMVANIQCFRFTLFY